MRKLTDTMNTALDALYAIQSTCTDPSADKAWGIGVVAPGQDPNRSCRALVKRHLALELDPCSGERRDGTGSFRLTERGVDLGAERAMLEAAAMTAAVKDAPALEAAAAAIMRQRAVKSAAKPSVLAQLVAQERRERDAELEVVAPTKLGTVHRATLEPKGASDSCAQWGGRTTTVATFDDLDDEQLEAAYAVAADENAAAAARLPDLLEDIKRREQLAHPADLQLEAHLAAYDAACDAAELEDDDEDLGPAADEQVTVESLTRSVRENAPDADADDLLLKVTKLGSWDICYRRDGDAACCDDKKGIRADEGRTELFKYAGARWAVA